jgi:hypothetical protein
VDETGEPCCVSSRLQHTVEKRLQWRSQTNHETSKERKPQSNAAATRAKASAPSRNGVIGARSKYALLPKSMRPKGVIVPRF